MTSRILVVDDSLTIRRVVAAILERHGYEVALASDGEDALSVLQGGEVKADLILLDFVMPRMNGYQFCRALRADVELAMTPVVLMSAKSDRIRDQFVQQTGAIDAITKPFDAQALVAVVENALRRVSGRHPSSARLPDLDPEEPVAPPVEPGGESGESGESGGSVLSGQLGVVPIGAILQLLHLENQTGVLVCRSGAAEVVATFRQGLIDLVQSSGAGDEFRLGRYFVEEGIVTPAQIDEVMARTRSSHGFGGGDDSDAPRSRVNVRSEAPAPLDSEPAITVKAPARLLLGTTLLACGKITGSQLRTALTRQSSELLYEVLRWPKGRFDFRVAPASEVVESAQLGLQVASVVMEGFSRVDEWRVLERTLGSFDAVLVRDDLALGPIEMGTLPSKERVVLETVDGERTVRAIIAASHMSSFDACRVLVQFLEARVLRRRVA